MDPEESEVRMEFNEFLTNFIASAKYLIIILYSPTKLEAILNRNIRFSIVCLLVSNNNIINTNTTTIYLRKIGSICARHFNILLLSTVSEIKCTWPTNSTVVMVVVISRLGLVPRPLLASLHPPID